MSFVPHSSWSRAVPALRAALPAVLLCLGLASGCDAPTPDATKSEPSQSAANAPLIMTRAPAPTAAPKEPEKVSIECKDGPDVDFHDKALEAEIRRKLAKPEGPIKKADLRKVKSVNLARDKEAKVDFLDPCVFPHLTQVKDLFLGPGALDDISPLAKLTQLQALRISMSQVSDLTPLKDLKKLDRLDLGYTQVRDVTPLSGLTALTELQLDNTKVSDVSPLAGLKNLVRLSLQRTDVKDLSPLKPLEKLKHLYIAGSRVEDPYAISRPGLQVVQE